MGQFIIGFLIGFILGWCVFERPQWVTDLVKRGTDWFAHKLGR